MDGLIAYALAKKYTDKVGQDIISAGFKVQVEEDRSILNRQGEEKVLYLLPKEYGSSQDGYDEFVYANNTWEWVGKTDVSLDYESLENKPQINGVELTGNKTSAELNLQAQISVANAQSSYDNNPYLEKQGDSSIVLNSQFLFTGQSSNGLPKKSYWGSVFGYCCIFTQSNLSSYTIGIDKEIPTNELGTYLRFNSDNNSARINYYLTINGTLYLQKVTMRNGNWSVSNWEELSGGGAQIVSGVVNSNGSITFTDSDGGTFNTSGANIVTSGNEQVSMGYDEGGFYFLFDDGQEGE